MKIEKILNNHKLYKIFLISYIWLLFVSVLAFAVVFIFTDKYTWSVKDTVLICFISFFIIGIIIFSLLFKSESKKINKTCNLLIQPDTFYLNGKDSFEIISNSKYKSFASMLYSNELSFKTEEFTVKSSQITRVIDEFHKEYANLYFFQTNESFAEHYLMSRSQNIKGFDKFKREAIGNTCVYFNSSIDIEKMNVEFSNNFYIEFKDNTILFIDFNTKNFDISKENLTNERFIMYINKSKEDIIDVYHNLKKLN